MQTSKSTFSGERIELMVVKPTMSEKKMVTTYKHASYSVPNPDRSHDSETFF